MGLNVITELIIGYALPGKPIAMMMFKTWGYTAMVQALTLTSDFKLGYVIWPWLFFLFFSLVLVVLGVDLSFHRGTGTT